MWEMILELEEEVGGRGKLAASQNKDEIAYLCPHEEAASTRAVDESRCHKKVGLVGENLGRKSGKTLSRLTSHQTAARHDHNFSLKSKFTTSCFEADY
jgi:hypothetical protein